MVKDENYGAEEVENLKSLVANLHQLLDLHRKYNCRLSLSVFEKVCLLPVIIINICEVQANIVSSMYETIVFYALWFAYYREKKKSNFRIYYGVILLLYSAGLSIYGYFNEGIYPDTFLVCYMLMF